MNKENLIIRIIKLWALLIIFCMLLHRMIIACKLERIHDDIKELKVYIEEVIPKNEL